MLDPHGSYVLNAAIDCFSPEKLKFLIELACSHAGKLAADQHGLCVLKKLISKNEPKDIAPLVSTVLF